MARPIPSATSTSRAKSSRTNGSRATVDDPPGVAPGVSGAGEPVAGSATAASLGAAVPNVDCSGCAPGLATAGLAPALAGAPVAAANVGDPDRCAVGVATGPLVLAGIGVDPGFGVAVGWGSVVGVGVAGEPNTAEVLTSVEPRLRLQVEP
jgi:hypothetical protein